MSNIFPEPEKDRPAPPPPESAGLPPDLPNTPPPYPSPSIETAETATPATNEAPTQPEPPSEWLAEESAAATGSASEPEPAPAAPRQESQALPPRTQSTPSWNAPLSESEERTWATLAHLTILINLFTGIGGPIAAFIIYLVQKDRSRYVGFQALQSAIFQVVSLIVVVAVITITWLVTGLLTLVLIGLLLIPVAILVTIAIVALPLVYGVWGAVEVSQSKDFRYWMLGDWIRQTFPNA